jgi:glycosyltransferase involved in cell wall biosynthesis
VPRSPVHILLSTELFYPDLPGGLMRFFRYGPGLRERGIQLHVVTLRHRPELAPEEEVNGIHIHRLTASRQVPGEQLRVWLLRQALSRALAIRNSGGLAVLQPAMLSHTMAPTLLRARFAGIPSLHNLTLAPESPMKAHGPARWRQRLRMTLMCTPLSRFVFLSHQLRRQYQERWSLRASQIAVIPNGVDLTRFHPADQSGERQELRTRHGFRAQDKVVLFVGGLMERKGVDILLEAWNAVTDRHPDAVLAIVGSQAGRISHERPGFKEGLETYLQRIDDLRAQLKHPGSIRLLGELADPAPCYRLADVFAFPSRREGLPNVLLEAMASGLPCLSARFDGFPDDGEELGENGRHHLALGHDPAEWSTRLIELLDTPQEKRDALGAAARTWMEQHHPLPQILDSWASLYHQLASN